MSHENYALSLTGAGQNFDFACLRGTLFELITSLAKFSLIICFLIFLSSQAVLAHGVEGEIEYFPKGVVVTATYDTGEPMSYAKVEIYAPDSKIRFQIGRTDRNGRFAFVPDVSGRWQVIVSDRLGHRLELSVNVKDLKEFTSPSPEIVEKTGPSLFASRKIATLVGILLIFGIFGWLKEFWRLKRPLRPR